MNAVTHLFPDALPPVEDEQLRAKLTVLKDNQATRRRLIAERIAQYNAILEAKDREIANIEAQIGAPHE